MNKPFTRKRNYITKHAQEKERRSHVGRQECGREPRGEGPAK